MQGFNRKTHGLTIRRTDHVERQNSVRNAGPNANKTGSKALNKFRQKRLGRHPYANTAHAKKCVLIANAMARAPMIYKRNGNVKLYVITSNATARVWTAWAHSNARPP